jgi:serine/threonine-protein kinase
VIPDPTTTPPNWPPKGYVAVDPNQHVPDRPDLPMQLERLDDHVVFEHLWGETYLPAGYKPESENDLEIDGGGRWPRVIIREDGVKFIRIRGSAYLRGAPPGGLQAVDPDGNPITSHYIRVPGFYIQEAEVTNGEIEHYLHEHKEDDADLREWKQIYAKFRQRNPTLKDEVARRYPAVGIAYPMARKYARMMGGLLPTEAEWEWAAKSCNASFWFAWGSKLTPAGDPPRARLDDPGFQGFGPSPVMSFKEEGQDRTRQNVYDMVGNVRELCADVYKAYPVVDRAKNSTKNPLVDERPEVNLAAEGTKVVVRGGSFEVGEERALAYQRWREPPGAIPGDVGFRVVIECPSRAEGSP